MAGYDLNTAAGQAEFERRMASVVRNEVGAYTRTALSQSLGGQQQTQNNLDNTNLSIVPIGSIIPFGGINLPNEFLWCDGSLINKDKYARLFTVLGVDRYGTDSDTQFYLPDLRDKILIGMSDVTDAVTNTNVVTHNIGSLQVTASNVGIAHIHSHDHSFNHGHSNTNAGQSAAHNHSFQGSVTSISRAAGNQAGLASSTHNHGFVGSTATHTHAHGLNATNANVGKGNSEIAGVTWSPNSGTDNTSHSHSFSGDLSAHPFGSKTINFIIKY